jgi:hypothetical protein
MYVYIYMCMYVYIYIKTFVSWKQMLSIYNILLNNLGCCAFVKFSNFTDLKNKNFVAIYLVKIVCS